MSAILTDAERARFISWLEMQAWSGEGILEQMDAAGMPEVVRKKTRSESMACRVVLHMLRSTESFSVDTGSSGEVSP